MTKPRFNPFSAGRGIKSRVNQAVPSIFHVSILFLLEGASNRYEFSLHGRTTLFQSFFCWKGHQIALPNIALVAPMKVSILFLLEGASNHLAPPIAKKKRWKFQSFFCWKGHQIEPDEPPLLHPAIVSILFLLEGASNHPVSTRNRKSCVVSILFLLEGASNLPQSILNYATMLFQSFFCWKGHQIEPSAKRVQMA